MLIKASIILHQNSYKVYCTLEYCSFFSLINSNDPFQILFPASDMFYVIHVFKHILSFKKQQFKFCK